MLIRKQCILLLITATFLYCGIASSVFAVPMEWELSAGGNGHYYEAIFVGSNITWEDASSAAQAKGSGWHLATITSPGENTFVEGLFSGNPAFFHYWSGYVDSGPWIGAYASTYTSGDWKWVTGETFVFSDWGPLEPFGNGDRISYALFGGTIVGWNDISSGNSLSPQSYIIENDMSSPVPEPSTLLLLSSGALLIWGLALQRKGNLLC